jgi:hypothetical protein
MTSKIKVDNITDQDDNNIINESGDVITVGAAGDTVAVAGNIVKTNAVQASDAGNIISQSGTTITIGASGDTVSLASGASQSGFGRAGSVDWQTGSIKTASSFTAASGEGYFIDTSSNGVTANLPAGSAGAIVAFSDYARNFATNALTIAPNGSEKIGGTAADLILRVDGQATTLVYVDSTKGWVNVQNAEDTEVGAAFVTATGGTIVTCGNFKTHIFTGPGTFQVTGLAVPTDNNALDYLVVAGGGGGASRQHGAGGGAGGLRLSNALSLPTTSPLANPTGITATVASFPISIGGGGAAGPYPGNNNGVGGVASTFSTITSAGGGYGATYNSNGDPGGSGGGAGGHNSDSQTVGSGNTPPVSPPQGQNGGANSTTSPCGQGGGGGGAGGAGETGGTPTSTGRGGTGSYISDSFVGPTAPSYGTSGPVGATRFFAGGGSGAASDNGSSKPGPAGGGGGGSPRCGPGGAGTANTGGGGGAGTGPNGDVPGGAGGSGIVMIRYKFQ